MTKTGALLVVAMMAACAADDTDVGAMDVDAGMVDEMGCEECAGEWLFTATACDTDLSLHVRLSKNRGVAFVTSLDGMVQAAGVDVGMTRVYVKDAAGSTWYLELVDDGIDATARAAIDVPDGGCEWVGDVAVDRFR